MEPKYVWLTRIIDGGDFDRVAYEAAFSTAEGARAWGARHYAECVENEEPAYKSGWRIEIDRHRLDWH